MTRAAPTPTRQTPDEAEPIDLPEISFTPGTDLASAVLEAAQAAAETGAPTGVVYLLHFDRPYRHAAHYTGWTSNLDERLAAHAAGRGARLLAVITAAGIGFTLARTWPGPRSRERALKNQGGAARRCPLCGTHPRPATSDGSAA
jgi:predicted GIY-YIG superfamily endonuclease